MTAQDKHMKPVKLAIDNAADVLPRVISAQGKACGGEFGLVLLPRQAAGMLVHQKDGMAAVWRNDGVGDAPSAPSGQAPAKPEVDALMKLFRSAARGGKDDRALKGTWKGTISCDDGAPDVRLERAVASYAVAKLHNRGGLWHWTLERAQTWYAGASTQTGSAGSFSAAVIDLTQALNGVLGEACAIRDSRRRGAIDTSWDGKRAADRTDDAKAPRGARSVETWSPRLEPTARRGASAAASADDARLLPVGEWTRYLDQEEAPEAREVKPSRAQRAALEAAGVRYDKGAGTFFGVTTTALDGFPAGSLIFSEPEDGAGFAIAKAELAPAGGGKARKARAADQARADAAVGALTDSSPARSPSPGQEATTAAQIEAAAEVLAETPVGPEGESGAAGVSFAAWQDIERALVNLLDAPEKSTQHRVGRALEAWRDGLAPDAESAHAKPSPGNRGWAVLSLAELRAELDRVLDNSVDDDDTDQQTRAYMAQVLAGFEAVTPPFAAAFALVAAARKHIANPKCKDEAREQSRAALAKAVDTLEAAATRRRAGGLPADQLAALRASARSVALTAAKLARSCAAGQLAMPSGKAESGAQGGMDSGGDPYATPRVRYIGARKVTVQAAGRGKDTLSIDTGKWSWTVERTHPIVEKLRAAPLPPLPMPRKPEGWTKTEWQGWAGELGRALGLGPDEFDVQWLPAEGVSKEGWQLVIPRGHAQHGRSAVELTFELALNQLMFVGVVEAPVIQKGDVVSYIKGRTPVVGTVLRVGEVDAAVLAAHTITAHNVRFVRLRLATEAEKAAAYGEAADEAEATPTTGKLPTDWSELPAWAEGWYRANGLSRNVPELAKRLTHHLFTGTFDDIVDPNINKVGAAAVQVLLGRAQPFKTAKAMKELFVGVPVLRLTGTPPAAPAASAASANDDKRVIFAHVGDSPPAGRTKPATAAPAAADKNAIIAQAAQTAVSSALADLFG